MASRLACLLHTAGILLLLAPLAPAALGAPEKEQAAQPFDVMEIRVLGNSVLKNIDVERAVYPSLGPARSFQDIEHARDALVAAYRSQGYGAVFVDIPEQEVKDGLVRLQVVEGRVDRVRITGARYFSNGRIRAEVPALQAGKVLNTAQLQQQLTQVNREASDRTVVPVLRAGPTPGTVDVDLKVKDSPPVHVSVDVNNRYTANTSPTRVGLNVSYDNLFQKMHSLSLQFQTAPAQPSEARVLAGTYSIPAGENSRLAFYAIDTASDVSAIGALSVLGAGQIYGLRYVLSLPGSEHLSHSFTLGPDYKDFRDTIRLADGSDLTPIHYLVWVGTYTANWQTPSTLTTFTVGPTFGMRGLVNDSSEFGYKRAGADGNFFYLRAAVQHERPLVFGTRLFARLTSQWTTAPLISNEQLALGGVDTVRGYLEAEALGDEGLSGALEWRAPGPSRWGELWSRSYLFAFYDAGYVRTLEALPGQSSRTSLSSWGLGLRLLSIKGLQASLDWAIPRQTTVNTRAEDSRVNFDVSYGF